MGKTTEQATRTRRSIIRKESSVPLLPTNAAPAGAVTPPPGRSLNLDAPIDT